jgi:hypothetical protein
MTKTSDQSPPPGFYNGDSQAIEAVSRIEATKVEKRRAARRAPATPEPTKPEPAPEPETETDRNRSDLPETETNTETEKPETDLNYLGLTKADIEKFTEAVERRGGRTAYVDWRVIGGIYWKASEAALKQSGQKSRRNPDYQKIFHNSIISKLPLIAENAGTAEQYRLALLAIEEADANEDSKLEFSNWFEKTQPRAVNPVALWNAFRNRYKKPSTKPKKTRNGTKHQEALAQAQQDAANKISELMGRNAALSDQVRELGGEPAGEPSSEPTAEASYKEKSSALDALMLRAWHEEAAIRSSFGGSHTVFMVFQDLLSRLAKIAFDHGVIGGDERGDDLDDVVAAAEDSIRNTHVAWSEKQQAEAEIDEGEDEDEDEDADDAA